MSEPAGTAALCVSCRKAIRPGARLCPHCGEQQGAAWTGKRMLKAAAAVLTLLSLLFGLQEAVRIGTTYRRDRALLRERLESVQTLSALRDYEAAWTILTQAQQAKPAARPLREVQAELAFRWMLEGYPVSFGWVLDSREDAGGLARGDVADRVHPPLVVAAVSARGETRAELEALVAWATFLRGRALHTARRDLGPDLRAARDLAPQAFTPNLLLGYWQATFEADVAAALQSWQQALAAGRDTQLVRRFQVSVLARLLREDTAHAARRALLGIVAEMKAAGEPLPTSFTRQVYESIYLTFRARATHFDSTASMLAAERQLALHDWVRSDLEVGASPYDVSAQTFQLIRAHLLEQAGHRADAIAAMAQRPSDGIHREVQARMDELHQRLTGELPADVLQRDPWRAHVHHLAHTQPGHPGFSTAMSALVDWWRHWEDGVGDALLGGRLPAALDAAIAAWEKHASQPAIQAEARAAARDTLRFLHRFRGLIRAETDDFAGGIAELEALARDPQAPPPERVETLFALAVAYTRSHHVLDPDMSDDAARIHQAYLTEGLDRLAAALRAGLRDWNRIERTLSRLRELPAYEAFSLRHGRVPPPRT